MGDAPDPGMVVALVPVVMVLLLLEQFYVCASLVLLLVRWVGF